MALRQGLHGSQSLLIPPECSWCYPSLSSTLSIQEMPLRASSGSSLPILPLPRKAQPQGPSQPSQRLGSVSHRDHHLHKPSPPLLKGTFQGTATTNSLRDLGQATFCSPCLPDEDNNLERPGPQIQTLSLVPTTGQLGLSTQAAQGPVPSLRGPVMKSLGRVYGLPRLGGQAADPFPVASSVSLSFLTF